ncbi:MAG: hypothetical protein KAU17_04960, partial [Spirochaetales bacterium]|nr:hypothetical protein [Spirochaetales bacterium]
PYSVDSWMSRLIELINPGISKELFISLNTTKTHLKNINAKLNTENRTRAVAAARQVRLI